jgi:hypothetical protein
MRREVGDVSRCEVGHADEREGVRTCEKDDQWR